MEQYQLSFSKNSLTIVCPASEHVFSAHQIDNYRTCINWLLTSQEKWDNTYSTKSQQRRLLLREQLKLQMLGCV